MLASPVESLKFVGYAYAKRLEKLGITKVSDLLTHVPTRFIDFRHPRKIVSLRPNELVVVSGQVVSAKNAYTRSGKIIQDIEISDPSGKIRVVFFNQPYLVNTFKAGERFSFAGKTSWWNKKIALFAPEFEKEAGGQNLGRLVPVYPETKGVPSKWLRRLIKQAFETESKNLEEFLSESVLKKYNLQRFRKSLEMLHYPKNLDEPLIARKRLAFNELLLMQLQNVIRKKERFNTQVSNPLKVDKSALREFKAKLPFSLTKAQEKAAKEILEDLSQNTPMNRLLEGDVGSGKTVVAALGALVSFLNGKQSIFMAPTQILATQHFNSLSEIFKDYKLRVSLLTANSTKKQRGGRPDIYVGTHALIHRKVDFSDVAFVVIDEQHKFGVEQRAHLIKNVGSKNISPHVLTMTATPIPRSVALTLYGDLALSILDELPKGRKKVTTWVIPPAKREGAYRWIEEKIKKEKVQAFVVCPLIEESQVETLKQVKAVTKVYESLKKIFPKFKIGILHGRQKPQEKEFAIEEFRNKRTNILVSTPVIEVGMDIPNASIILVEAAERFGLSQLHQLRGRVGRGETKSYCLLFSEVKSQKSTTRLSAMTKSLSGFELAELDLSLRGPGEIFGTRQSGFTELRIARWTDIDLIKFSRQVAEEANANQLKYKMLFEALDQNKVVGN